MAEQRKEYLNQLLTELSTLPCGPNLFYECQRCGVAIPSMPPGDSVNCKCYNIKVDVDAGRLSICEYDKVRLFYS